ncbi:gliding motility-associated C-terminal domain-containing protein [Maribacter sp. PR1]|uniref:Gliding motility-associated C-terminal domain-containing protein n=1 Tax=Maribacter cobaltidurans TaxID=1178778 RepID=A0ABU7IRL5_9FLAO|nr:MULTISPECIES: gliding motility-associated C-terminal domain-containing protein [Maribacter]MDC6387822.1 gliding motility-associated C-terminal domain-containing protein [Maribacter sp. PR1]MEE1975211.1 gliding motility-associated C-terminal domain-containing protein [Maribacter cobaltidurans]
MKKFYKSYFLTAIIVLIGSLQLSAQAIVINAPEPADNPNLAGTSVWGYICAGSGGFNEYFVNVTWAGTANSGNQFILELSDANGSFGSPVELANVTDKNNTNDFDIGFSIPEDTRGLGYKMRVRSTDPVKVGAESEAYNMFFMDITTNLNISELGNGVPPGTVCATGPITLQVDNIPNPETYQYIWYRSGTLLAGESGHTLNVTQSGMYNAYIDYGPNCTGSGNTDSNIVDVTIGGTGTGIAISTPSQTLLCPTDSETLSIDQTDASWSYQWYKNDTAILGAIGTTYTVDGGVVGFEGDYAVEITGTGICTERSAAVSMSNPGSFTVTRDNPQNIVVLPAQQQTLSVSTNASAPTYKWFRNDVEITGETNNTLNITEEGTYYAQITETGGSCGSSSKNSDTTIAVSPASFEVVVDYADNYTSCVTTSIILEVVTINAVATNGTKTDVTTDLIDAFAYQWQKEGTDIAGQNGKSISLASNQENGNYKLDASIDTYNESSNTLSVQLLTSDAVTISSTSSVYCSASDIVSLSSSLDLTTEIYEWQLDGAVVSTTDISLDVSAAGTYRLVLDRDGCQLISNEVTISPLDDNLITLEPSGSIVIPEGTSRTISANGGTTYRWMDANNAEISTSDSASITEPGTYTLIASIDNCDVVKQFEVSILDTFKVPNVITVNGDGINDQWVIPNSYSNRDDVNVIIYNGQGQEIINEFNYKNNWPQTSTAFARQNMVFYYKIRNASEVLKQGTITVIR